MYVHTHTPILTEHTVQLCLTIDNGIITHAPSHGRDKPYTKGAVAVVCEVRESVIYCFMMDFRWLLPMVFCHPLCDGYTKYQDTVGVK